MKRLLLLIALLALTACAPVAETGRDWLERDGGATITYVAEGVSVDPAETAMLDTTLVAESELPIILAPGQPACVVEAEVVLKCRLGRVESPVIVRYTGTDVIVNVAYRRAATGNTIYLNFAR